MEGLAFPELWRATSFLSGKQARCFEQPLGAGLREHTFTEYLTGMQIVRHLTCRILVSHFISTGTL